MYPVVTLDWGFRPETCLNLNISVDCVHAVMSATIVICESTMT